MIDDTRLEGREIDGKVYVLFEDVVLPMLNRRDEEIERLREALRKIEERCVFISDAHEVARAALGEEKE